MTNLNHKVAIVTGSSRGIGAAIAKRLARNGAKVVLNYSRDKEGATQVADEIKRAGGHAFIVQGDVGDPETIQGLVASTLKAFGRIDILVNNAGIVDHHPLTEVSAGAFDQVMSVNVRGPLLLSAEVARHLPDGGRIINISSVAAANARAGGGIYAASKAAIEALTRSHAAELGIRNITVNAVAPGATETEMLKTAFSTEMTQQIIESTPLKRMGQPEDIADVVAFLASEEGRWITGQVINASGGRAMRM